MAINAPYNSPSWLRMQQYLPPLDEWDEHCALDYQMTAEKQRVQYLYKLFNSMYEGETQRETIWRHMQLHASALKNLRAMQESLHTGGVPDVSSIRGSFGLCTEADTPHDLARLIGMGVAELYFAGNEQQQQVQWDELQVATDVLRTEYARLVYYERLRHEAAAQQKEWEYRRLTGYAHTYTEMTCRLCDWLITYREERGMPIPQGAWQLRQRMKSVLPPSFRRDTSQQDQEKEAKHETVQGMEQEVGTTGGGEMDQGKGGGCRGQQPSLSALSRARVVSAGFELGKLMRGWVGLVTPAPVKHAHVKAD